MLSRQAVRVRRLAAHLCKAMSSDHHASSPSFAANGEAPTAAILIIGDEILKVHMLIFCHLLAVFYLKSQLCDRFIFEPR